MTTVEFIGAHKRQLIIALIVAGLCGYVLFGLTFNIWMKLVLTALLIFMGWAAASKRDQVRTYVQGHMKESMIMLVDGLLIFYIMFVPKFPFWQKLLVTGVLIFGGYEAIARVQGKKSPMDTFKKGMAEAQKGVQASQKEMQANMRDTMQGMNFQQPDMDLGGFGPFQPKKKGGKRK